MHGENQILARSTLSDVDIVVGSSPHAILARSLAVFHSVNLHPIVINAYDAGGSASVYMASGQADGGLQLDMYFDPRGIGRLGLQTSILLANAVEGTRWRTIAPEHGIVYLLRKRHWKGDADRVDLIRQEADRIGVDKVEKAIGQLANNGVGVSIRKLLSGEWHTFRAPAINAVADQYRRTQRLVQPVGYWAETVGVESPDVAQEIARRFGRFLVAKTGQRPEDPTSLARWLIRDVAPLRWTPGLFVSWTKSPKPRPRANLELTGSVIRADEASRRLVVAMEARLKLL